MSTNRTLSGLPAADGLNPEDLILVTQAGLSKKATVGQVQAGVISAVVFQQEATESEALEGLSGDTVMTARRVKAVVDEGRTANALRTVGTPHDSDGVDGAIAINLLDGRVYGPKVDGEWASQVWRAACTGGRAPNQTPAAADAKIMSCNVRYSVVPLSTVKLVASNFYVHNLDGDSVAELGTMTVHATVCWPTKDDVLGDATWSIAVGKSLASPEIELSETIPAGEKLFIGWYATPSSGGSLPLFFQRGLAPDDSPNIDLGEAVEISSSAPDKTAALSTISGVAGQHTFGPSAVLALQDDTNPCVAVIGGSISTNRTAGWDEYNNPGWISGAFGADVATLNMGRGGSRGARCVTNGEMRLELALLCGATHVIIEYGFNDWVQGASADEVIEMRRELGETWLAAGIRPAITTVTPANTSTDDFATLENQGYSVPPGPRQIINAAARRVPAPFIACIEAADAVEPYRDSGFYKPGYTDDGTHPILAARDALIAAVDTSVFKTGYLTTDFGRGRPDPISPYPPPVAGGVLTVASNGALQWAEPTADLADIDPVKRRFVKEGDWLSSDTGDGVSWRSVCWAGDFANFVAVGVTGVATSPDGVTWTAQTEASADNWNEVCYSPDLQRVVAVAGGGSGSRVMSSDDGGLTWTSRTPPQTSPWVTVCWASGPGLFVAIGQAGALMTSPDGITWTNRTAAASNNWQFACWSQVAGLIVAVSNSGTGDRVMTSPDGVTWTSRVSAADVDWRWVCYAERLGRFVAVGNVSGGNNIMTSPDGITWMLGAGYANNMYSVAYYEEIGLFAAVCNTGTGNRVALSTDGLSWEAGVSTADNNWQAVCVAPELGLFCAVSADGIGNRSMTSVSAYGFPYRA